MSAPKIGNQNSITPDPGLAQSLDDSSGTGTAFSASVLPASSAWRHSEVLPVAPARFLALQVFYAAHASTTTGQAKMQVRVSNNDRPATDDSNAWTELTVRDDLLGAAAAIAGSLSPAVETAGPLRNPMTVRGAVYILPAAVANSDKINVGFVFDVTGWRWAQVRMQETGDTTNRGTVTLKASLTA